MATAKAKERQFHVVPVPAIFTRGRWECRDFKDIATNEHQILDFTDKHASSAAQLTSPTTPSTTPLTGIGAGVNFTVGASDHGTSDILNSTDSLSPSSMVTMVGESSNNGYAPPSATNSLPAGVGMGESSSGIGNVVAIDNKIEQAMDLVKTHLTFAVREEVEILRSTIADLESKVSNLEHENQILRQFAPAEVVNNLPLLMNSQQQMQHQQKAQQQHLLQQQLQFHLASTLPQTSQSSSVLDTGGARTHQSQPTHIPMPVSTPLIVSNDVNVQTTKPPLPPSTNG